MMKRTLIILAVFIGVVVAMTMNDENDYYTAIGKKAPWLNIPGADREVVLDEMRGEYVLLNFWSSSDAPSRIAVNKYNSWMESHPEADVSLLGVNFDNSENLFKEIVRRDGLDAASQFNVSGEDAKTIIKNYGLENGYGTVLINPQGKIVAHNPSAEDLATIFPA